MEGSLCRLVVCVSINRAALMIRQAQKPKRIKLYKWETLWIVRNEFVPRYTYCGSFEDARETVETELLERLWQISMREELA